MPQSSYLGTTYYSEDLPQNIQSYIEKINFDATAENDKGVQVYFKGYPQISGKISEEIARFIVNNPSWKGRRDCTSVSDDILTHWVLANPIGSGIDYFFSSGGSNRESTTHPARIDYYEEPQPRKAADQTLGKSSGAITNLLDRDLLTAGEGNNADSTTTYTSYPWQELGQSTRYSWPKNGIDQVQNVQPDTETVETADLATNPKLIKDSRVVVTTTLGLHVRSVPGDLSNDQTVPHEALGSSGTVKDGPIILNGFTWWKIEYDDGKTGWSAENWLESIPMNQKPTTKTLLSISDEPADLSEHPTYSPSETGTNIFGQTGSTDYNDYGNGASSVGPTAKFIIPPGGQITGTDGAGNPFQATADSNGYVAIPGSPGLWKITASAPGYETLNINNYQFSGTEVYGGNGYVDLAVQKVKGSTSYTGTNIFGQTGSTDYNDYGNGASSVGPTAKFIIPPGGQITGTDGAGNPFQATADSNGYVAIPGSPGLWKITASAPGYETLNINNYQFSGTEVYGGNGYVDLAVQKIKGSTSYTDTNIFGQTGSTDYNDYGNGAPMQNQIDPGEYFESYMQSHDVSELSEDEVNNLMNQLDEMQSSSDQQPASSYPGDGNVSPS